MVRMHAHHTTKLATKVMVPLYLAVICYERIIIMISAATSGMVTSIFDETATCPKRPIAIRQ